MFIRNSENNQQYKVVNSKTTDVVKKVEAGLYTLDIIESFFGINVFIERTKRYANSKMITNGVYGEVVEFINKFTSQEMYDIRESMGMLHKLGMIFNGAIGTGKTFLAGQIAEKLAEEKDALGIIVKGEPKIPLHDLVDMLRVEQPDRLVIIIMDEYEKHNRGNSNMLHFLDGKDSRNNVLVLATVNSTNGIPTEIKDRKGRIEKIFNFTVKSEEVVKRIIENVLPEKYAHHIDIDKLVKLAMKDDRLLKIDNLSIKIRDLIYESIRKNGNTTVAKQTEIIVDKAA